MSEEPDMNLGDRMLVERQVAVVWCDPHFRAPNVLGEPPTVVGCDELIPVSVADEHGDGDRLEGEAPGRDEGQIVVKPAVDAAGLGDALVQVLGEAAGQ